MEKQLNTEEYTVKAIADMEGVSVQTVYSWCADGFLIHSRRPTKKGQGGIVIKGRDYRYFQETFMKKQNH